MTKKRICLIIACMLLGMTGCASKVEEGSNLLEEQKYEEAQVKFQEAIDAEKDLAEAYRGLGFCYYEQENYEEALNAFELALNAGAEETAALYNLAGISAMQTGEYETAVFYFENGSELADAGEELKQEMAFNLVVSYEQLGELGLAKEKLEEYVRAYPDDETAQKELEFLNTQS